MVAVVLFGVYGVFGKLCHENSWSSVSVKGQSVTKNDEFVFSTLCLNMHSLKTLVHLSHAFCIVPSSVLHSGIIVTVQWRKLFLMIFISCAV